MPLLPSRLRGVLNPAAFHGGARGTFEGWYVKLVSADQSTRLAVIPGLFHHADGSGEAFVQVLDGASGRSWYQRYEMAEFAASRDVFDIRVGPNRFSSDRVTLDVPAAGLHGEVTISSQFDPWPVRPWSPGIMGWYAWVPFMECYHGVVSFGHSLAGDVEFDGRRIDLAGGRGYIEKDWGQAFPAGYLWLHSNHFAHNDASLVASVALIPWRGKEFRGFIVGLRESGRLHRFATYNGAQSTRLEVTDDHIRWTLTSARRLRGERTELTLEAERASGGLLHAPVRTEMHRRVEETLSGTVAVRLRRGADLLFEDVGSSAGLEIHGEVDRLLETSERR